MEKYYKKWFKILNIPAAILFVVVILVPFIMGMAYSFTAWRGSYFKGSEHWYGALVGFKNYIKVFHSQKFITSFIYTIKFTIVAVVVKNFLPEPSGRSCNGLYLEFHFPECILPDAVW